MRDEPSTGRTRRAERPEQGRRGRPDAATGRSPYDRIAGLYDAWSRSVTEDIAFYVAEARKAAGAAPGVPVVELGVGTGRVAVPTALAGVALIGVDSSAEMLAACRARAEHAGVAHLLDLRPGDLRDPPVTERVRLVTCPFRAYLHLADDEDRLAALRAARDLLLPGGRLVFDVFAPSPEDVEETHGRWLEREPGIWERADWDETARRLTLRVRGDDRAETTLTLAWLSVQEWHALLERAGFVVEACYGWFDHRPYDGGEDSVWLARRA
jgi:SAM-dependent methyltransferase